METMPEVFVSPRTWKAAAKLLTFKPKAVRSKAGMPVKLRVHFRDHKRRELPSENRTLETNYGSFGFSQEQSTPAEARRRAIEVSYGQGPQAVLVGKFEGRVYELGPEVPPDDIDGRSPAVVVWSEGPMFYFLASGTLRSADLMKIAHSLY